MIKKQEQNIGIAVAVLLVLGITFYAGVLHGEKNAGYAPLPPENPAEPVNQPETANNLRDVPQFADILRVRESDAVSGTGDILLIEYSDYECPFCKRFHPTVQRLVDEGAVRWIYRHYPLPFHETADEGARLAECVRIHRGNDAFWDYTNGVFKVESAELSVALYRGLATESGLSPAQADECLESGSAADSVVSVHNGDAGILGVNGTPGSFLVNTATGAFEQIPGALPYEAVRDILNAVR